MQWYKGRSKTVFAGFSVMIQRREGTKAEKLKLWELHCHFKQ
jgi:hypothetical protein